MSRNFFLLCCNITNITIQIPTDSREPAAVANPIGYKVDGNSATTFSAPNCISMETTNSILTVRIMAYFNVCTARFGFFAPIFWAPSAETVDNMDEGIKNKKLMIFSTITTAAASFNPC